MNIKITYYLDIVSSWCYWAEPAWAELKRRYANAPVQFDWAIALLDENSMSKFVVPPSAATMQLGMGTAPASGAVRRGLAAHSYARNRSAV